MSWVLGVRAIPRSSLAVVLEAFHRFRNAAFSAYEVATRLLALVRSEQVECDAEVGRETTSRGTGSRIFLQQRLNSIPASVRVVVARSAQREQYPMSLPFPSKVTNTCYPGTCSLPTRRRSSSVPSRVDSIIRHHSDIHPPPTRSPFSHHSPSLFRIFFRRNIH